MSTSEPQARMPLPRILAVDDTPGNLVALDAVLGEKYELVFAHSGPQAIDILLRDRCIDVILMDLHMPAMDGYETTERIKRIPGCEEIPLIFISAVYNQDPQIKKGYAAGAIDYFTKPFDPDILRMKVEIYASFRHRSAMLKQREAQLRESEDVLRAGRKLSALLEGLPLGVIIADVKGRVCQANEAALAILQSARAIETGAYGELLTWWEKDARAIKTDSALSRALHSGQPSHNEVVVLRCLDGRMKSLVESTSPLRGLDGSIVGAVIAMHDVTEQKKVEEELEQRITRLVSLGIALEQTAPVGRESVAEAPTARS